MFTKAGDVSEGFVQHARGALCFHEFARRRPLTGTALCTLRELRERPSVRS